MIDQLQTVYVVKLRWAGHAMWLGNGGRFLFLVSEGKEKGHFLHG